MADIDKANGAFDFAVAKLETAKKSLEKAKVPFQNAFNSLNSAQQQVDNLCTIQNCPLKCISGITCNSCTKTIFGVSLKCLCCSFTSCMISVPNPLCVAANVLCRIVRGVAYLALEAAKIFVRAPMLALDLAKGALSAAQFVVDKARVVLEIAKAVFDLAKLGLEGAKGVLSVAKAALEAVKQVVKLGLAALNFVIQYGIQTIIDVRNCGFELTVSTHDESVFDVHCEVNAFKTGWRTVRIRINFTDIVQSIWNAAKATIEAILNTIGNIFSGRKRRELQHQTIHTLYKFLRHKRQADNLSESEINDTLNVIANTIGFQNTTKGTEYEFRREVYETKCQDFNMVYTFLRDAMQALNDISTETASSLLNATGIINELGSASTDNQFASLSLEKIGIDPAVAQNDFNISMDDLTSLLNAGKDNLTNNEYLNDIQSFTNDATDILRNQTDDANNVNIVNQWIVAMENTTTDYFDEELCASFLDCAHYGISVLYEMFTESDVVNRFEVLESVSNLEDAFLNLTSNFTHTFISVNSLVLEIEEHLEFIDTENVFCSTPPVMMAPLANKTILSGYPLVLVCNATADPTPTFMWYKDDEAMEGYGSMVLHIPHVNDSNIGWYYCVAGNVVANLTFADVFVNVTGND